MLHAMTKSGQPKQHHLQMKSRPKLPNGINWFPKSSILEVSPWREHYSAGVTQFTLGHPCRVPSTGEPLLQVTKMHEVVKVHLSFTTCESGSNERAQTRRILLSSPSPRNAARTRTTENEVRFSCGAASATPSRTKFVGTTRMSMPEKDPRSLPPLSAKLTHVEAEHPA